VKSVFVDSVAVIGSGGEANCHPRVRWAANGDQVRKSSGELRRASPVIRLVLQVTALHSDFASLDLSICRPVFTCSDGDMHVIDNICLALKTPGRPVSPTQFHNVVHNAAAGHWSLGVKSVAPSISISARYGSFAAGIMEAIGCLEEDGLPVLLVSYMHPGPPRLDKYRPRFRPFALSMLLQSERTPDTAFVLHTQLSGGERDTPVGDPDLERLRALNPAAKALPLLLAMAAGKETSIDLSLEYATLEVEIRQCLEPYARHGASIDAYAPA
jgi:hypothetical protein